MDENVAGREAAWVKSPRCENTEWMQGQLQCEGGKNTHRGTINRTRSWLETDKPQYPVGQMSKRQFAS